ncbi:hypothetical protein [Streptomyces hesseae]|uniref:Secreted protein n=1 Tax=Streptomyces hesseae TaxID=3075519 RepID=A0ABU2SU31_9ACTN|nr:hypothetical protein [Streptomyces sp. DSM 40473]MDT0452365.1 hypothetical protein [Streptomyces sp. DSM 40473]
MRRRLVSLALLGSALTMGLGLAGAGTASAATPAAPAAVSGIPTVSPKECVAGGGQIVFRYIYLACVGGKYDGYRIGA